MLRLLQNEIFKKTEEFNTSYCELNSMQVFFLNIPAHSYIEKNRTPSAVIVNTFKY